LLPNTAHFFERLLALPMKAYCTRKARSVATPEEKRYWEICASPGSLHARRLVVSAKKRIRRRKNSRDAVRRAP
jgi:hypothetical protein